VGIHDYQKQSLNNGMFLSDGKYLTAKGSGPDWRTYNIPEADHQLYLKEAKISLLRIDVSFSYMKEKESLGELHFNVVLQSIGVSVVNLQDAPLKIDGIKLENIYTSDQDLINILSSHYIQTARSQALRLVGALDIIGNPINVQKYFGTGITEFFSLPVEGFVKGPLEGFKGIGQGTISLVSNTIGGTFYSISKITGALSRGLTMLTMVFFGICLLIFRMMIMCLSIRSGK
jgi:vacuolar protein sorting-associated protein 13A/C